MNQGSLRRFRKHSLRHVEVLESRRILTTGIVGDFDESGDYSTADIDALCAEVAGEGHDIRFDIDGDLLVGPSDIEQFLNRAGSIPGDANLSGSVDFADFLLLSSSFGNAGTWSNGEFGCTHPLDVVGFDDFLTLSQNFGKSGIVQLSEVQTVSPGDGEDLVNTTREAVVQFNGDVNPETVNSDSIYLVAGGERLDSRVVVSSTERFATVFHDTPLPSSTAIRMVIDGDQIVDRSGRLLDADSDGQAWWIADYRVSHAAIDPHSQHQRIRVCP